MIVTLQINILFLSLLLLAGPSSLRQNLKYPKLELAVQQKMTFNSCFHLPSVGILGVCLRVQFTKHFTYAGQGPYQLKYISSPVFDKLFSVYFYLLIIYISKSYEFPNCLSCPYQLLLKPIIYRRCLHTKYYYPLSLIS